jgi:hypothetical protein
MKKINRINHEHGSTSNTPGLKASSSPFAFPERNLSWGNFLARVAAVMRAESANSLEMTRRPSIRIRGSEVFEIRSLKTVKVIVKGLKVEGLKVAVTIAGAI